MTRFITLLAAAVLTATTVHAQEFRAQNRVTVVSVPGGFEVRGDAGHGARGMWCAAADYARRVLGAGGFDRIYIAEGRVPGIGQRAPVKFTMDPSGLIPSNVLVLGASLRTAGASLSVDHAIGFCADSKVIER